MAEHERSLSVRLPDELLAALRRLADEDQRSLNSEVVWALRKFVERRDQATESEETTS